MNLLTDVLCMNIKNKHSPNVQCISKATVGDFCKKHSKHPVRFILKKDEPQIYKIQKWYRKLCILRNFKQQGPSRNDFSLSNNITELYSFDSFETIPKIYYYSFSDTKKNIWAFDIRTLSYLLSKTKTLINPYTQEKVSQTLVNRILKRIEWLKKYKYDVMYKNNDTLTKEQFWNQRVLDVFSKMEEHNYLVNSDWFHQLSKADHIDFYKKLYDIWNYRLNLTIQQKNQIVPGFNNKQNKLFKYYTYEFELKDEKSVKKYNLNMIDRFISSSTDKTQKSLGIMYVLMALCYVNENIAEAYPWIHASIS